MLRFVHLSDIHFIRQSGEALDVDVELRDALLIDLRALAGRIGEINGVLVTGDIAYSGKSDEYKKAGDFLEEITSVIGCGPAEVWCVPGNHDISRAQAGRAPIQSLHSTIRGASDSDRHDTLRKLLTDESSASLLLQPIEAYLHDFAKNYDCQITAAQPWWDADIDLGDGFTLTLRGMTSTLVSDHLDDDEKLVLGKTQSYIPKKPGRVAVALCHHPPSWLLDQDDVSRSLRNYAHVQLFGHKHTQDITTIGNSVVLAAGAVHPSRKEQQWEPRYNIVCIEAKRGEKNSQVRLLIFARRWDDARKKFAADGYSDTDEAWPFTLQVESPPIPPETEEAASPSDSDVGGQTAEAVVAPGGGSMLRRRLNWDPFSALPGIHLKLRGTGSGAQGGGSVSASELVWDLFL